MAMTPAERKRKQLERDQNELRKLPDSTYPFLKQPFYEWIADDPSDWTGVWHDMNAAGYDPPSFKDDSGPRSVDGEVERGASEDWHPYDGYQGSIGRAESIIDYLLSAVEQFAGTVNTYKVQQINERIAELEQADLSDPEVRKRALADIVRLTKMKEHLGKTVRVSLRQWKVKGI